MDAAAREQQVMEFAGCSIEVARAALEAAGPGGVELALEIAMQSDIDDYTSQVQEQLQAPCKVVCLVRQDLGTHCP